MSSHVMEPPVASPTTEPKTRIRAYTVMSWGMFLMNQLRRYVGFEARTAAAAGDSPWVP